MALLGALAENLLALAVSSEEYATIIRNTVDASLFGGPLHLVAGRVYDYIDKYHKPPGTHLSDIMVDKLNGNTPSREAALYGEVVDSIRTATPNAAYVMNQLGLFVQRQSLRTVAVDLAKALQRDTEESLAEAEILISKATKKQLTVFDPGTRLSDKNRALQFLEGENEAFPTGIPELDKRGFGPTRQELWLLVANTKAGKSFGLMFLAKMALMQQLKVCHITLEMSEKRCSQRYFQLLFSIAKRKEIIKTTKFQLDDLHRITGFTDVRLDPKLSLDDPNITEKLSKCIDKWATRLLSNIIVKQFPTGTLTVRGLTAYLDNLEQTERFVPDLLIVDYPDLMKLDKDNYRLALDEIYKDLRGLAVTRNLALAVVSQSHREAAKAKLVGGHNVAEAYSKIAHSDCVVTYSQTEAEAKLGLARLHVAGGRNDEKVTVCISQAYGIAQFVYDSAAMTGNYFESLPQAAETADD